MAGETKEIVINPITRLEGHGKITIFLDDHGDGSRAYFQVPELRGFESFLVGREAGKRVIGMRKDLRGIIQEVGGKVIHPVLGLPGGVAKAVTPEMQKRFAEVADRGFEFALCCEKLLEDVVLGNPEYVKLITSDVYTHRTHYMGLVDDRNRPQFYDGAIRVVDPSGREIERFPVRDYLEHIAEHVEPWTYVKFPF